MLANLELLEEELTGEQREAAASALRSSRRMRRLVADLLLLARADAGRGAPHRPVDLSEVVTDAAAELEPVAGDHEISIDGPGRRPRGRRARRAPPPRAQPDGERAPAHRSGHRRRGDRRTPQRRGGAVRRGRRAGIPVELREKVFERFYRGSGEHSGSSGLGLSIVRAVAESHRRQRAPGGAARRPRRALRGQDACRLTPQVVPDGADFPGDMSDTTSQQLVVFSLGGEEYALPIGSVHEIIRFTEPRTVASDAAWIRGVIGLRGKIIPIFDLASRMELDPVDSEPGKIVIVETGTGQVGVMVDEVEEVLTVSSDQLEDVPTANRESIEAIAKIDDRLVILLNPEGLFARSGADEIAAA